MKKNLKRQYDLRCWNSHWIWSNKQINEQTNKLTTEWTKKQINEQLNKIYQVNE